MIVSQVYTVYDPEHRAIGTFTDRYYMEQFIRGLRLDGQKYRVEVSTLEKEEFEYHWNKDLDVVGGLLAKKNPINL